MVFPAEPAFLKSYSVCGRKIKSGRGSTGHRLRALPIYMTICKRIHPLAIDYLIAPPRMALYMEYSTRIYHIYLQYVAPEDIHVYSIDEVMMDVTAYLRTYGMSARDLHAR